MRALRSFVAARPWIVAWVLPAALGCTSTSVRPGRSEPLSADRLITAQDIARLPAATDAWDVLRGAGVVLSFSEGRNGDPTRLRSRRGRSSIVLSTSDATVVTVDGTRLNDIRALRQIGASTIAYIRVLSAIDGTTKYGTGAGGGVVEIVTREAAPAVP